MKSGRAFWRRVLRATPLHPQWLLGARTVPPELLDCRGLVADLGAGDRWLQTKLDPSVRYMALDLPVDGGQPYGARPDAFARVEALPLADASVDAVACFEVLEHVDAPALAIAEAARVLRSGGLYVVSTPFLYPLHDQPRDFRRYTPFGLEQALSAAGFEVVSIRPMLRALEVTGLLAALAIAGGVAKGGWRWALLPLAAPAVLAANLTAWLGARLWPEWEGMAMGYEAVARKP